MISFNKGVLKLSHGDSKARASKFIPSTHLESSSVDHGLDRVDLKDSALQEDFGTSLVYSLDPFVKD